MTSEQEYDVREQPQETCPTIDKVIRIAKSAESRMRGYERSDDVDELKEVLSDIEFELSYIEDLMEAIRKNAELIRDWGQDWKELATQHPPEVEKA